MNKTLHKKLTEKYFYEHTPTLSHVADGDMLNSFATEIGILQNAANDLLQPRPQAIANILRMAKDI